MPGPAPALRRAIPMRAAPARKFHRVGIRFEPLMAATLTPQLVCDKLRGVA